MKALFAFIICSAVCNVNAMPLTASQYKTLKHETSFDENLNRYPSPYAMIEQFHRIVPHIGSETNSCLKLDETGAPVSGVIDPLQMGALEQEPGAMFYQYYQDCVRSLVADGFSTGSQSLVDNVVEILGANLKSEMEAPMTEICRKKYTSSCDFITSLSLPIWKDLPEEVQRKAMRRFIYYLAGPDIILQANHLIGAETDFGRPFKDSGELADFLDQFLKNQKDSLTLANAYAETAIILRLGPLIKD